MAPEKHKRLVITTKIKMMKTKIVSMELILPIRCLMNQKESIKKGKKYIRKRYKES